MSLQTAIYCWICQMLHEISFQIINIFSISRQIGFNSYCDTSYWRGGTYQVWILLNSTQLFLTRMLRGNNLTRWPWPLTLKINRFQIFLRTKYVPSLVKIHWRMLILVCSQGCYRVKCRPCDLDLWHMTLKINRIPDSPND